jgi:hypothetical protein
MATSPLSLFCPKDGNTFIYYNLIPVFYWLQNLSIVIRIKFVFVCPTVGPKSIQKRKKETSFDFQKQKNPANRRFTGFNQMCPRLDSNQHAVLTALPPQGSASTNFATRALVCKYNG